MSSSRNARESRVIDNKLPTPSFGPSTGVCCADNAPVTADYKTYIGHLRRKILRFRRSLSFLFDYGSNPSADKELLIKADSETLMVVIDGITPPEIVSAYPGPAGNY